MKKRKDGRLQKQITIIVNGRKKQKCFYGKTEREINKKILDYKGEVERGRYFCDVVDEWKEQHYKTIRYNTQKAYNSSVNEIKEHFKGRLIKEITPQQIKEFIDKLAVKKANNSKQTVMLRIVCLKMIFNYAITENDIQYNPALGISPPKNLKNKSRDAASDEDVEKIKRNKNNPDWLFAYVLLYTGCRRSEALALMYEDFNWEDNTIRINKAIEFRYNKPCVVDYVKTEQSVRNIIFLNALKEVIPQGKTGFVFKSRKGKIFTRHQLAYLWKSYNLDCTPHCLRHYYVTMLYEAGIDAETAMTQTGHSNIVTMRNKYTHIRKKKIEEAANKLNAFIG